MNSKPHRGSEPPAGQPLSWTDVEEFGLDEAPAGIGPSIDEIEAEKEKGRRHHEEEE